MLDPDLREKAAAVLPKCRTLFDAEHALGGGHQPDPAKNRDWRRAMQTWGIYEGYKGYPLSPETLPKEAATFKMYYMDGWYIGRRLAMDAQERAAKCIRKI